MNSDHVRRITKYYVYMHTKDSGKINTKILMKVLDILSIHEQLQMLINIVMPPHPTKPNQTKPNQTPEEKMD